MRGLVYLHYFAFLFWWLLKLPSSRNNFFFFFFVKITAENFPKKGKFPTRNITGVAAASGSFIFTIVALSLRPGQTV